MRFPRSKSMLALAVSALLLAACGSSPSASSSAAASLTAAGPTVAGSTGSASPSAPATSAPATSAPATSATSGSAASTPATSATSTSATSSSAAETAGTTVTLVTHDSFAVDKTVLAAFEKSSGITVKLLAQGDAGALTNKLILTKGNPIGDAMFGIDNTFASRALDAGILAPYTSPESKNGSDRFEIGGDNRLTPIDYGDVCINVDHTYFTAHNLTEPSTFEDLAKPAYKNLLVVESPETSSPGLAFLLATIAHFGADNWQTYWKSLAANGVKVTSGWTDAYTVDFSGSTGHGDRPLVLSYASSPPDEVKAGETVAPTGALLNTCFRQVEYAGVLAGAKNPAGAEKVVDFLLSKQFQAGVAEEMYVYPVDSTTKVPASWQKFAPLSPDPAKIDPTTIAKDRDAWISAWSDLMDA